MKRITSFKHIIALLFLNVLFINELCSIPTNTIKYMLLYRIQKQHQKHITHNKILVKNHRLLQYRSGRAAVKFIMTHCLGNRMHALQTHAKKILRLSSAQHLRKPAPERHHVQPRNHGSRHQAQRHCRALNSHHSCQDVATSAPALVCGTRLHRMDTSSIDASWDDELLLNTPENNHLDQEHTLHRSSNGENRARENVAQHPERKLPEYSEAGHLHVEQLNDGRYRVMRYSDEHGVFRGDMPVLIFSNCEQRDDDSPSSDQSSSRNDTNSSPDPHDSGNSLQNSNDHSSTHYADVDTYLRNNNQSTQDTTSLPSSSSSTAHKPEVAYIVARFNEMRSSYDISNIASFNEITTLVQSPDLLSGVYLSSPFPTPSWWNPLSSWFYEPVQEKHFFMLDCFTPTEQQACQAFIKALEEEQGSLVHPAGITCQQAREIRLKLLRQFGLYRHPEFINLIVQFPEYKQFICAIAQRQRPYARGCPWSLEELSRINVGGRKLTCTQFIAREAESIITNKRNDLLHDYKKSLDTFYQHLADTISKKSEELARFQRTEQSQRVLNNLCLLKQIINNATAIKDGILSIETFVGNLKKKTDLINLHELMSYEQEAEFLKKTLIGYSAQEFLYDPGYSYKNLLIVEPVVLNKNVDALVERALKPLEERIQDYHCAQDIEKIYDLGPAQLFKPHAPLEQRAILDQLRIGLFSTIFNLNKEQRALAGGIAHIAFDFNKRNDTKTAQNFVNLLSKETIQQLLEGVAEGVCDRSIPLDPTAFINFVSAGLQSHALAATLSAAPSVYIAFYGMQGIVNAYHNVNKLMDDFAMLTEAFTQGDSYKLGYALANVGYDFYDTYTSTKNIKNISKCAYKRIQNKRGSKGSKSKEGTDKKDQKDDPRSKITKAANMYGVFKASDFGKMLKEKCVRTSRSYKKSTIYRATKDVEGTPIQEGDYFYLDRQHYDHLEVFDGQGNPRTIIDLNGKVLDNKYKKVEEVRSIKDILK